MIYADDTQVYGYFKSSEILECIACMQRNAQAVFDWATLDGLELNVKKTKAITFCSTQNLAMLLVNLPKMDFWIPNPLCRASQESVSITDTHNKMATSNNTDAPFDLRY